MAMKLTQRVVVLIDPKTEEKLRLDAALDRRRKASRAGRAFFIALARNDQRALAIINEYKK